MKLDLTEREARVIAFALYRMADSAQDRISWYLRRRVEGLSPEDAVKAVESLEKDRNDAFHIRERIHTLLEGLKDDS